MRGCKFCRGVDDGFLRINETVAYSEIEMAISSSGMLRVRIYPNGDDSGHFTTQDIINIDYCPFCGRKLRR